MVERSLLFNNRVMIPFALALVPVMGFVIFHLYRTERRMIRRRVGAVLTVLRISLLIVVLMMLTEPIISITITEPRRGTLIVMVDNSRSMQIPDRGRPGFETLRIADVLGGLPEGVHASTISLAEEDLARLLGQTETAAWRWNDFAEVMALGVLEGAERNERLDETLADAKKLRGAVTALIGRLSDAGATQPPPPIDIARGVEKMRAQLAEVNADIFDGIIREVASGEFRARLTVGRLRGVNQLFTRAAAQMAQMLTQLRELAVEHDAVIARDGLKLTPESVKRINRATRLQLAGRVLANRRVGVIERLKENYKLRTYLFSRTTSEFAFTVDDNGLTAQFGPPASPAEGLYTDLATNLQKAVSASEDEEIGGVVVVSDGRFNHGEDPLKVARMLGARGIGLYPVTVGSRVPPRDIAVVKIASADVIHEKDPVEPRVLVKAAGFAGQPLTLSVREKGKVLAEEQFTVPKGGATAVVKLTFVPQGKGQHNYVVTVPVQSGEVFTGNNEKPFALSVLDRKLKVLLVDGGPRWEYRYLKNMFLRDKRIGLTYLLLNPLTTSKEEIKRALEAFPHKREEMFVFDTIVIGDVNPEQLSPGDLANLEAFVNDRGGSLIVVAGREFMPSAYGRTPLGAAMPVVAAEDARRDAEELPKDGFKLKLTGEARGSSVFRLSPDEKENTEIWAGLPKMMWYAPVKAVKPGAVVWAHAGGADGTEFDSVTDVRKRAVILSHAYGLGRVFYVGTDGTWRWRYKVADKYHHQFWGQVILWATSGRLPVGTERVKLGTDKFEYLDDEDVVVRARVLSSDMLPIADAMVSASLVRKSDDGVAATTRLEYLAESGGHYEGKFPGVRPGSYAVKLTIPGMEGELAGVSADVEVIEAPTREMVELSADAELMDELALRSGGRSFALHEIGRLPDVLKPLKWHHVHTREVPLWSHWLLLIVFCAIVTVEWVLRKIEGLL